MFRKATVFYFFWKSRPFQSPQPQAESLGCFTQNTPHTSILHDKNEMFPFPVKHLAVGNDKNEHRRVGGAVVTTLMQLCITSAALGEPSSRGQWPPSQRVKGWTKPSRVRRSLEGEGRLRRFARGGIWFAPPPVGPANTAQHAAALKRMATPLQTTLAGCRMTNWPSQGLTQRAEMLACPNPK